MFFAKKMPASTERVFWLVMESALKHKWLLVLIFIANTVGAIFEGASLIMFTLAVAVIMGDFNGFGGRADYWVDWIFNFTINDYGRDEQFFALIIGAICFQIFKSILHYGAVAATAFLRSYAMKNMQSKMVHHIMSFSLAEVSKYPGGELANYVGLSSKITDFLFVFNAIFSKVLMLVTYIWIMLSMSVMLTLVAFSVGVLMFFAFTSLFQKIRDYGRKIANAGLRLSKEVMEFFYAPKFIRIYGKEEYVSGLIIKQIDAGLVARRNGSLLRSIIQPLSDSIASIFAAIMMLGGYALLVGGEGGEGYLSTILAFVIVFRRMMGGVSDLNGERASIYGALPAAEKVAEMLRVDNKDFTNKGGETFPSFFKSLELKQLDFAYNIDSPLIIKNINLSIEKGDTLGIVGASGSGKTTLVDIILGLYSPVRGELRMNGLLLEDVASHSWRKSFSVVSQNSEIFNRSIYENLTIVNPQASKEEVVSACKVAFAHEFIIQQSEGYGTMIGDRGHKLSGGQIQRLALARAMLANTNILVLDEATSALDSLSERKVIESVKALGRGHTVIQVAHRLSTISEANNIIVLDSGEIIEQGSHYDLISKSGVYSEMWNIQSSHK